MARRTVVRLGIPGLIVAALAIVALWRVGPPPQGTTAAVGTSGTASLEGVVIRERVGERFYWIGSADEHPVFVVLDPDVKRTRETTLRPGARVTLIGMVRPMPKPEEIQQRWHLPPATVADAGTYLYVTEIR